MLTNQRSSCVPKLLNRYLTVAHVVAQAQSSKKNQLFSSAAIFLVHVLRLCVGMGWLCLLHVHLLPSPPLYPDAHKMTRKLLVRLQVNPCFQKCLSDERPLLDGVAIARGTVASRHEWPGPRRLLVNRPLLARSQQKKKKACLQTFALASSSA